MSQHIISSAESLQRTLGEIRQLYEKHRYLKLNIVEGKARSINQNDITHVWYSQLARELTEDSELGWKCYCKLHHGVPILRLADDEFRAAYDLVIKPLDYEKKLEAMKFWPVTSHMTKAQLSQYAEEVQKDFGRRGVTLEFPQQRFAA